MALRFHHRVKGFVELMGGCLRVISPWRHDGSPGSQFRFTLVLPDADDDDDDDDARYGSSSARGNSSAVGGGDGDGHGHGEEEEEEEGLEPHPASSGELSSIDDAAASVAVPGAWRVLLADDSGVVRLSLKFFLRQVEPGWTVDEAATGEQAVAMATEEGGLGRYDLILPVQQACFCIWHLGCPIAALHSRLT